MPKITTYLIVTAPWAPGTNPTPRTRQWRRRPLGYSCKHWVTRCKNPGHQTRVAAPLQEMLALEGSEQAKTVSSWSEASGVSSGLALTEKKKILKERFFFKDKKKKRVPVGFSKAEGVMKDPPASIP